MADKIDQFEDVDIKNAHVLALDDDSDITFQIDFILKGEVASLKTENDPNHLEEILKTQHIDVLLLDMNYSNSDKGVMEGHFWLERTREISPKTMVVLMSSYATIDMAVQGIKRGAVDVMAKPIYRERLLTAVTTAMRMKNILYENQHLKQTNRELATELNKKIGECLGVSPQMKKIFNTIEKISTTDANVLILGEHGTGKELIAREIYRKSQRSEKIFVSVDMGSLPDNLFESELFGHVKGAFTDAKNDRVGRFENASGGTLFLDEIGNLPMYQQAKLLTALQSRTITPVGSNTQKDIDLRLICATNVPIEELSDVARFRQDLLFRINTIEINLPPLRERTEDLPVLTQHYLKKFCAQNHKHVRRISKDAMEKLERYDWPGNIRELMHVMERAVILCEGDILQPEDFGFIHHKKGTVENQSMFHMTLDEMEMTMIQLAIKSSQHNISKAARQLGLSRAALYRRMEKHGISENES